MSQEEQSIELLSVPAKEDPGFRWTLKRKRFVSHFVRNGGNGSKAATDAGYKEYQEAARLLQHAVIRQAIQDELRSALQKEGENSETIIARWANMAQANLADYFKMDQDGEISLKDLDSLTNEQQLRLKKITATRNQYGQNITVELHDVLKANDRLAEIHGLLRTDANFLPPDETAKEIRDVLRKMDDVDSLERPPGATLQ